MFSINNWFAHGLKRQSVGSAIQAPGWRTTTHLKVQYAFRTGGNHSEVILLEQSIDWSYHIFDDISWWSDTQILQAIYLAVMNQWFDLKIIPEFGTVVEWLEKLEFVFDLSGVKQLACVITLHLTGGAFMVYQPLIEDKKSNVYQIKEGLITAFAADRE